MRKKYEATFCNDGNVLYLDGSGYTYLSKCIELYT